MPQEQTSKASPRTIAHRVVSMENEFVRVTVWTFQANQTTGVHRHAYPYVVVPVSGGRLEILADLGRSIAQIREGEPYFREAGVTHEVVAAGDLQFVEVEVKR